MDRDPCHPAFERAGGRGPDPRDRAASGHASPLIRCRRQLPRGLTRVRRLRWGPEGGCPARSIAAGGRSGQVRLDLLQVVAEVHQRDLHGREHALCAGRVMALGAHPVDQGQLAFDPRLSLRDVTGGHPEIGFGVAHAPSYHERRSLLCPSGSRRGRTAGATQRPSSRREEDPDARRHRPGLQAGPRGARHPRRGGGRAPRNAKRPRLPPAWAEISSRTSADNRC